jgi:membrane protease subunit HflK
MKNKKNLLSDILSKLSKYFVALIVLVIILISFSGFKIVQSGNVALILRFGKIVGNTFDEKVHGPGLLVALPFLIDEVVIVPMDTVMEQSVTMHYTESETSTLSGKGYVITGDQNIALISASVKYTVSNPVDYKINVKKIDELVNAFVGSAMVDVSANMSVDSLLTSEQEQFTKSIIKISQDKLDNACCGITISTIELTKVSMPMEVKETYDNVNSASVQAKTIVEDAELYESKMTAYANSIYDSLLSRAKISYSNSLASAKEELAEFYGVLDEYEDNKDVVTLRLFNDKITKIMSQMGKVRIVNDGESKIVINTEK